MSSIYTGNGSGVTARGTVAITVPADGDAANAASVNTPLETEADVLDFLMKYSALTGSTRPNADVIVANGQAGDDKACLQLVGAVTNHKLIAPIGPGPVYSRLYCGGSDGFEVTFNAYWDASALKWTADSAVSASILLMVDDAGVNVYGKNAAASPWTTWDREQVLSAAGLSWLTTGTGAADANPPADTAITNEIRAKNVPKAWISGEYYSDGFVAGTDGFNMNAPTKTGSPTSKLHFELATPMANSYFAIVGHVHSSSGYGWRVSGKAGGGGATNASFDLILTDNSTGADVSDIHFETIDFDLAIFGKQTS